LDGSEGVGECGVEKGFSSAKDDGSQFVSPFVEEGEEFFFGEQDLFGSEAFVMAIGAPPRASVGEEDSGEFSGEVDRGEGS
jgi:hypothetical protein